MSIDRPPNPDDAAASADSAPSALDLAMLDRALALAHRAAELGEAPIGAVVYRGEQIVGEGFNRRERRADPTAHAEIIAMRKAARIIGTWRLNDCSLAVTLEPCPMCAGAMVNARLGRVVWGAPDPKMGCVRTLYALCSEPRFNHRVQVIGPVNEAACAAVLRDFFQARRGENRPEKPRPR